MLKGEEQIVETPDIDTPLPVDGNAFGIESFESRKRRCKFTPRRQSGKYFWLIEGRNGNKALMVSPEGEVKILDFKRLEYMPVLGLNINIAFELLTETQLRVYYEHNQAEKFRNYDASFLTGGLKT